MLTYHDAINTKQVLTNKESCKGEGESESTIKKKSEPITYVQRINMDSTSQNMSPDFQKTLLQ